MTRQCFHHVRFVPQELLRSSSFVAHRLLRRGRMASYCICLSLISSDSCNLRTPANDGLDNLLDLNDMSMGLAMPLKPLLKLRHFI